LSSFCAGVQHKKASAESLTLVVTPKNLLKEIPYQSEAHDKVAVGIIGCGVEGIATAPCGIEMFGFEENATLAYTSIDKEIEVGEISNFLFVLREEIGYHWIVAIGVVFCKVIIGNTRLQIERSSEEITGEI
jgi:hypothetical protein